ncbi:oxidoreductase [Mycolicibacterium wolinskyi]|uniref:Oxidoreductase n=1 Tax=Mycolicibacterium wolinskyi TaxID=59750 RepID=A0A132PLU4_9MYCO|nr:oxidoreductase [Mycolicibacterium wolinskyi]KWX23263.1 oxidoreductase [Mycolicibacterium wolinskyi]
MTDERSREESTSSDPLAPLAALPGVAAASDEARDALGRAHRHKVNLRGWPQTAAEAALRAAKASAVLDGGSILPVGRSAATGGSALSEDGKPDPVTAGAIRVAEALEGGATSLVGVWQRAPLQALARLHALAAADLADDEHLGRPRTDPEVGPRLELLTEMLTGGSRVPAPILAAVAHGELLTLAPFGSADGVVARAVSRLVTIASGLDPHGLGVPEVHWMRKSGDYRAAARGFAAGTSDGLTAWLLLSCEALHAGAREALQIAQASLDRPG